MADLYDAMSSDQQVTFREALYAHMAAGSCPNVDVSTVTNADSLTDAGNRAVAIDCFQQANGLTDSVAGVLDQPTLDALGVHAASAVVMTPSSWTTGEKVAAGVAAAAVVGGIVWLATRKRRPQYRRRAA